MKIRIIWVIFLMPMLLSAQSGKVFDQLTLPSEILKMERNYAIYLPPDYETSKRQYPVLYLLHGMSDDQTAWIQFGEVLHITDAAIGSVIASPMIIVMPDADTKVIGYVNRPNGEWSYEQFFFDEFMPYVESDYRIKKTSNIVPLQACRWVMVIVFSMHFIVPICFNLPARLVPIAGLLR